jgi:SAM-dependent methyltransferase
MTIDEMLDASRAAAALPVDGWDFSELRGGLRVEEPPWDFDAICAESLAAARGLPGGGSALDEGTGGGERLIRLRPSWPARVVATEGWEHNLPVARAALEPLGVSVVSYDADADAGREDADAPGRQRLPFPDASFDIVMNCHEAMDPEEDARVLAPGGRYLTQQVGHDDFPEAHALFGTPSATDSGRRGLVQRLEAAGLVVDRSEEWHGPSFFADVPAYVRYETLVPWDVPDDFSVDRYRDALVGLHEEGPARGRPLVFTNSRYLALAHRPDETGAPSSR